MAGPSPPSTGRSCRASAHLRRQARRAPFGHPDRPAPRRRSRRARGPGSARGPRGGRPSCPSDARRRAGAPRGRTRAPRAAPMKIVGVPGWSRGPSDAISTSAASRSRSARNRASRPRDPVSSEVSITTRRSKPSRPRSASTASSARRLTRVLPLVVGRAAPVEAIALLHEPERVQPLAPGGRLRADHARRARRSARGVRRRPRSGGPGGLDRRPARGSARPRRRRPDAPAAGASPPRGSARAPGPARGSWLSVS